MQQMACRYSHGTRGATMTGVVTISSGDEHSLQSAVANVGPVSTYIDASHSSFQVSAPLGNRVCEGGSTWVIHTCIAWCPHSSTVMVFWTFPTALGASWRMRCWSWAMGTHTARTTGWWRTGMGTGSLDWTNCLVSYKFFPPHALPSSLPLLPSPHTLPSHSTAGGQIGVSLALQSWLVTRATSVE